MPAYEVTRYGLFAWDPYAVALIDAQLALLKELREMTTTGGGCVDGRRYETRTARPEYL